MLKSSGALVTFYSALGKAANDDAKAHHAYTTWGFTDLSDEKMAALNLWARFLYEPLCERRAKQRAGAKAG